MNTRLSILVLALAMAFGSAASLAETAVPTARQIPQPATPSVAARAPGTATWQDRLMAELQRRKRYPDALRELAGESGTEPPSGKAILTFTLDRTGKVVAASVSTSSGRPEFDAAALAMAPLGAPFPPPPANAGNEPVRLTVPVTFIGARPAAPAAQ